MGFPGGSDSKESACSVGDPGSIPGLGRSPGEGKGNALQYSCLENPMDGGAWQATVHGVSKSQTWLSNFTIKCQQCTRASACKGLYINNNALIWAPLSFSLYQQRKRGVVQSSQCCVGVWNQVCLILRPMVSIRHWVPLAWVQGFPGSSVVKKTSASAGDAGSIPGWGRSPGEENGYPLQYSCLENPINRGDLQATVHEVA